MRAVARIRSAGERVSVAICPASDRQPRLPAAHTRSFPMLDVVMLAIGLGFFALSVGYVYACERL